MDAVIQQLDVAALLPALVSLVLGGLLGGWFARWKTKQVAYREIMSDDDLALDMLIWKPTADGSPCPGLVDSIRPGKIRVRLFSGKTWIISPSGLINSGYVKGGTVPDDLKRQWQGQQQQ